MGETCDCDSAGQPGGESNPPPAPTQDAACYDWQNHKCMCTADLCSEEKCNKRRDISGPQLVCPPIVLQLPVPVMTFEEPTALKYVNGNGCPWQFGWLSIKYESRTMIV